MISVYCLLSFDLPNESILHAMRPTKQISDTKSAAHRSGVSEKYTVILWGPGPNAVLIMPFSSGAVVSDFPSNTKRQPGKYATCVRRIPPEEATISPKNVVTPSSFIVTKPSPEIISIRFAGLSGCHVIQRVLKEFPNDDVPSVNSRRER